MKLIPIVALLWASVAYGVTGDLNKDGTVDFDDFFLFADNFGKSGPVEYCGTETLPPITITGSGNNVSDKFTLDAGTLYILRLEKSAESYFALFLIDGVTGEKVLLLNESSGETSVSTSFNVDTTKQYLLEISNAQETWTITIE